MTTIYVLFTSLIWYLGWINGVLAVLVILPLLCIDLRVMSYIRKAHEKNVGMYGLDDEVAADASHYTLHRKLDQVENLFQYLDREVSISQYRLLIPMDMSCIYVRILRRRTWAIYEGLICMRHEIVLTENKGTIVMRKGRFGDVVKNMYSKGNWKQKWRASRPLDRERIIL